MDVPTGGTTRRGFFEVLGALAAGAGLGKVAAEAPPALPVPLPLGGASDRPSDCDLTGTIQLGDLALKGDAGGNYLMTGAVLTYSQSIRHCHWYERWHPMVDRLCLTLTAASVFGPGPAINLMMGRRPGLPARLTGRPLPTGDAVLPPLAEVEFDVPTAAAWSAETARAETGIVERPMFFLSGARITYLPRDDVRMPILPVSPSSWRWDEIRLGSLAGPADPVAVAPPA